MAELRCLPLKKGLKFLPRTLTFAKLVSAEFHKLENSKKSVFGENAMLLNDACTKFYQQHYPAIYKVSNLPSAMVDILAFISKNKSLKEVGQYFKYLETVGENYY